MRSRYIIKITATAVKRCIPDYATIILDANNDPSSKTLTLTPLCTERANPLLHQFSSTKTLVERLYSSVLLIECRHFNSILIVRLSPVLSPKGLRTYCVGFIKLIKPTVIPAKTGEHGAVKSSLNISVSCIRNCQMRLTRATLR